MLRKKIFVLSGCIFLFGLAFFLAYFYQNKSGKNTYIVSPIPNNLGKSVLAAKNYSDIWFPDISSLYATRIKKSQISAGAAISYDLTTNKLLYAKNIKKKYPIASLTKIMTALVALENIDSNAVLSVNNEAALIGEDSMGLEQGEKLSFQDLLYGLILHSANDAAEVIVRESFAGRDNFVFLMNKKAEDLGLSETHFTNPTGLAGDGKQYSSAYDLLVISRAAMQKQLFRQIAATFSYHIPASSRHKEYYLENETNLITSYPGVKGIKTGYTDEAGYCLVTYLDYEGHEIIAILLNSQNRRQEMKDLLDYSLKALGVIPPPHS